MWLVLACLACSDGKNPQTSPAGRYSHVGALSEDGAALHIAGGSSENGRVNDAWAFDLSGNTWSQGPELPESIFRATAVRDGDVLLVFAGTAEGGVESDRLYRWNLGDGSWTLVDTGSSGPPGRYKAAAVMAGEVMVLHGGRTNDDGLDVTRSDLWTFDPTADTWTQRNTNGGPGPLTRQGLTWDAQREMVWVSGGLDGEDVRHDWLWSLDLDSGVWARHEVEGDTPGVRASHTFVAVGGKLLLWGGSGSDDSTWVYDPDTGAWTRTSHQTAPSPRDAQVADLTGDGTSLYLMGGDPAQDDEGDFVSDLWRLDLDSMAWTQLEPAQLAE